MKQSVPVIEKESFFPQHSNVHIHRSSECMEFVGVLHRHDFVEIVYVISGSATHILGDNTYLVKKGDVVVVDPNEDHAFIPEKNGEEEFLTYDLMFTPDFLDKKCLGGHDFSSLADSFLFYSLFQENPQYHSSLYLIPGCGYGLYTVFDNIYYEYHRKDLGYIDLIRIYVAQIIILLLRKLQKQKESALTGSQQALVQEVISYIENNYSYRIRAEEIASNMFFNRNYIAKLFKQETGRSIREFVSEIRIKEACKLLASTDMSIADIASACGFLDMKTFYQFFKKNTGFTPKAYRDQNAGE